MELREIRTFLQIAQKQSFSKAAEALGYSQAAVTVQIKQLEEELGIHLFDRLCGHDPRDRRRCKKRSRRYFGAHRLPHDRNDRIDLRIHLPGTFKRIP